MAEELNISLLGGFRVDTAVGPIDVPPSAQRLVAYLGLQEQPVRRRRLAGVLWPDVHDDRSAANLRSALWRAQRAGDLILADRTTLRLQPAVDVDVRRLAACAGVLASPGDLGALPDGLRFDCDLLPGWYDDWVVEERERLRQTVLVALDRAVPALIEQERVPEAIRLGQQAVRLEPLSEQAQRSLIAAYRASGDRGRALLQYREHEVLLWSEMGIRPSGETRALVCDLVDGAGEACTRPSRGGSMIVP